MKKIYVICLTALLASCQPKLKDDLILEQPPIENNSDNNAIELTYIQDNNPFGKNTIEKRRDEIESYQYGYNPDVSDYYVSETEITEDNIYENQADEISDKVYFGYNSHSLSERAKQELDKQINWLNTHYEVNIIIEGHCDERGTRQYNLALGEKRADSVKKYLILNGIEKNRVNIVSYGKEHPEKLGSNKSAWSKNRRAVTVLAK